MHCDLSPHLFDSCQNENNITHKCLVGSNSTNQEGINYTDNINQQFLHHNIYERSDEMLHQCNSGTYDIQQLLDKLNKMDKFITITMSNAEKKFVRKRTQSYGLQQYSNQTFVCNITTFD
jgi:hypothetical protein